MWPPCCGTAIQVLLADMHVAALSSRSHQVLVGKHSQLLTNECRPACIWLPHPRAAISACWMNSLISNICMQAGLHVAALSSRSQEKANKLCKEHGIDHACTDVRSVAEKGEPCIAYAWPMQMDLHCSRCAGRSGSAGLTLRELAAEAACTCDHGRLACTACWEAWQRWPIFA